MSNQELLTADLIQGFVGSILSKRFDEATRSPDCHREWWELCCSKDPFVAIAAPRGHAKSTAITFAYVLAAVLFRAHDFVIVVSDTETQANLFLGAIKTELEENNDLRELFQLKRDEKGHTKFIKDSESDLIAEFEDGKQFRIIAKGSEQKLRGLLWNGRRPNLLIGDDLENDEIVMNKDRRTKFSRWFYGAFLPCRADRGKVRIVGTILHMDSQLNRLMPDTQLIQRKKLRELKQTELKEYTDFRLPWKSVKYKAHNHDKSLLLWPEKKSKDEFEQIEQEYQAQGLGDVYAQEYLNNPIDESVAYFKKKDFKPLKEEDKKKNLNYYLGVDLALSESNRSDWSVFIVAGVDQDRNIQVRNVLRERLDSKESTDTLFMLHNLYRFEAIGLGEDLIQKSIGPWLNEEQVKRNIFLPLVPIKHQGKDKEFRARPIQARMRAGTVKFDFEADWFPKLEDELLRFPRDKHDDQVDALAHIGQILDKMTSAPTDEEVKRAEYEDEFERSGMHMLGKNKYTGY